MLSTPYSANGNGIVNGSGPQFASVIAGVPLYEHQPIPGVTQPGTVQWLNPNAFVSAVDPGTGACNGGDSPKTVIRRSRPQRSPRSRFRLERFTYLTKWFALTEHVKLRFDTQFFNVFNHPNFGLPSMVLAGVPGKPSTQTGFGALTYTTSPPTGLLGVGLGGDSTPYDCLSICALEFLRLSRYIVPGTPGTVSLSTPCAAIWIFKFPSSLTRHLQLLLNCPSPLRAQRIPQAGKLFSRAPYLRSTKIQSKGAHMPRSAGTPESQDSSTSHS